MSPDFYCDTCDICDFKPHGSHDCFLQHKAWLKDAEQERDSLRAALAQAEKERDEARARLSEIDTPEIHDFVAAVTREAAHQRNRWGSDHDAGKSPADWFWLIGYLAGKALHAATDGRNEKLLHHIVTTASAACNWHAAVLGLTNMRPGIMPPLADIDAPGTEGTT